MLKKNLKLFISDISEQNFAKQTSVSQKKQKGFTLIEILLYISISVAILLFVSLFLSILLDTKTKNQTIAEVDQQGMQALEIMTQTLRNAKAINSPAVGASSPTAFSIDTQDPVKNPTIFDISNGIIRIKEGAGSPINLTSTNVTASGANFENITRPTTNGMMRIQFVLTYVNSSGRNQYNYTKTFYNSISLR